MQYSEPRKSPIVPHLEPRAIGKRVGLVLLSTDHTTEPDFRRLLPPEEVGLYANRVTFANPTTPENLRAMEPRLAAAAADILPEEELDAICYSCTAASVVMGDAAVEEAIQRGKPGTPVITPALAACRAFAALGARRISLLTPYLHETSRAMADYFIRAGLQLVNLDCFGLEDDRDMARISREDIVKGAVAATERDAEALFVSCTNLRAVSCIEEIERLTGRPVVSSNLASIWMTHGVLGLRPGPAAGGRLLALDPTLALRRSEPAA